MYILGSNIMGYRSVSSPNWKVKVPYLCLFNKMVNNETSTWSIVQGCVIGAKPTFANVTCVIYISFNAPLGLLNGISGKKSCKYLILWEKCKPKVHSIVPNKEEDMGALG